ncbi:hypothetical protein DYB37_010237 [Aphanomyces astaci]|uniref:Uncharacterized protein n=1 Tax=Aphanomyces astaci TaxID=112090 RepID=A0A3R7A5Z3_APHAT|nr:hypothetical protein DYB35_010523 [Aphanomyces astaci]RHZ34424.1 hypothetical protein DYB37_010237 [Aphanomyces astaci]
MSFPKRTYKRPSQVGCDLTLGFIDHCSLGTTGVISTVGAFGSNEHMQRLCGDATIEAVRAAKEAVHVNNTDLFLPLQLVGAPLSCAARQLGPVSAVLSRVPVLGGELLATCPVGALAKAAVLSAIAPVHCDVLDTANIIALGDSFHETVGA